VCLFKGGCPDATPVYEHVTVDRAEPIGQACVLSVNRCRAACRETPRATAFWFHDRSYLDGLMQPCLVCAYRLGDGCDCSEVVGVVDLGGCWVELVGHCSNRRAGRSISSSVCRIVITSSSEEPVELRS
jgi:hypothetical protein